MRLVLAPKVAAVEADTVAAEVEKGGAEVDMALAEEAEGRPLKPSEISRHYFGRGLEFFRDRPGDALRLMLRKAGEVGRWPDLLTDAVAESDGVRELRERLVRENRIFLEDAVPATRVRAYDWLAARGLAPEGFDPLASAEERRAALARLEQAEEAAAGEGSR